MVVKSFLCPPKALEHSAATNRDMQSLSRGKIQAFMRTEGHQDYRLPCLTLHMLLSPALCPYQLWLSCTQSHVAEVQITHLVWRVKKTALPHSPCWCHSSALVLLPLPQELTACAAAFETEDREVKTYPFFCYFSCYATKFSRLHKMNERRFMLFPDLYMPNCVPHD